MLYMVHIDIFFRFSPSCTSDYPDVFSISYEIIGITWIFNVFVYIVIILQSVACELNNYQNKCEINTKAICYSLILLNTVEPWKFGPH